jgi:hypothetical protein
MSNDVSAWQTVYDSLKDFQEAYSSVHMRAKAAEKKRNYRAKHMRRLHSVGLRTEDWTQILPQGEEYSETLLKAAAKCAKEMNNHKLTPETTIRAVTHVTIQRIRRHQGKRGGAHEKNQPCRL